MNLNSLKGNPFFLSDEDISWVEKIYQSMDEKEKIGQLFHLLCYTAEEDKLSMFVKDLKIGGIMLRPMPADEAITIVNYLQSNSKIPFLISGNLENGGSGIAAEGTKLGSQTMISATNDDAYAKALGEVCSSEGAAIGANYAFAPVVDIDYNWRNPITNTRTLGSNPDAVLSKAMAYMKASQANDVCVSIKHFPGDGRDERDQHLCVSVNDCTPQEWDATYGKVYGGLIEAGAKTVMVGHIACPRYAKKINPAISDEEAFLPGTLSKEILQGLLRERLGFEGLVITDATSMAGFAVLPRHLAVPATIAAGCDMFLFSKNLEEDYAFMCEGVKNGTITQERLEEAVLRILALKASIKLHKKNLHLEKAEAMKVLGKEEHVRLAKEVADKSITLVKEEKGVLPISTKKGNKVMIFDIESGANALGYERADGVYDQIKPLLEKEGFEVSRFVPNTNGMEGHMIKFNDMIQYDYMIYLCNLATKSNQTAVRIEWINPMGLNLPNYTSSVPTIFVSTENPYHMIDVPMVKTFINTYGLNKFTMQALVDKLVGKSEFKGVSPADPFVDSRDARLLV